MPGFWSRADRLSGVTIVMVFSDVHSNSFALGAVLDHAIEIGADLCINLGDAYSGVVDPAGTARLLRGFTACPLVHVRGNHDRTLAQDWERASSANDAFAARHLTASDRDHLASFAASSRPTVGVLAFHGSPSKDSVPLLETFDRRVPDGIRQATDEEILSRLGGVWECPEVILCGHSHRPALRWLAGGTVVMNPGSVGLPAYWDDDPHPCRVATGDVRARCGLLQHSAASNTVWTTTLLALPYDHDAASRLAAANGGAEAALAIRTGSVPMPPPE